MCVCVCASVCEYGLEQWSSERQRRRRLLQGEAASAPAGWGVLLLSVGASSTCFLLSLIRSLPPFIPSTAWSEAPQMLGLLQTWQRCCNSSTSFSPPPPPPPVISCAHAVPSRAARQMHDRAFLPTTPTPRTGAKPSMPSSSVVYTLKCVTRRHQLQLSFFHFTLIYLNKLVVLFFFPCNGESKFRWQ